jgi:hypothetical protein
MSFFIFLLTAVVAVSSLGYQAFAFLKLRKDFPYMREMQSTSMQIHAWTAVVALALVIVTLLTINFFAQVVLLMFAYRSYEMFQESRERIRWKPTGSDYLRNWQPDQSQRVRRS